MSQKRSDGQMSLNLSPRDEKLIQLATDIRTERTSRPDFFHSVLCQVGLPRRATRKLTFERTNGQASLLLTAGRLRINDVWEQQPLPSGTTPRLALLHVATEAVRTSSRTVPLGESLHDFMRRLRIGSGTRNGREYKLFIQQINALAACRMQIGWGSKNILNANPFSGIDACSTGLFSHEGKVSVTLTEEFFSDLQERAVPLDPRALAYLQNSALALDIYTWLAHKLRRISRQKGEKLSWKCLRDQFGQEYSDERNFKKVFLAALQRVSQAYPDARIERVNTGLVLCQSRPPVDPVVTKLFISSAA